MKLRVTMILILVILNGCMIGVFSTVIRDQTLNRYSDIERQQATVKARAIGNAFNHMKEVLQAICLDWASWDDTYAYMQDRNQHYVASNLVDSTFYSGILDTILYYDEEGSLVLGAAYTGGISFEAPATLQRIGEGAYVNPAGQAVSGVALTTDGLLLYSAQPILTSDQ